MVFEMSQFQHHKSVKPLNRIDRKILCELQSNGRVSYVDLASKVGLSTSPCIERVKRLEREGYITGYTAILEPQLLDASILIYVEITLEKLDSHIFNLFTTAVLGVPQVMECHMVSGGFDYLLKIRIKNMPSYRELLGQILNDLPGIRDTNSYVVMEEIKETSHLTL